MVFKKTWYNYHRFAPSQRQKILRLLLLKGKAKTSVLVNIASQYNARIKELRALGYAIVADPTLKGFRLLSVSAAKNGNQN